MNKARLENEMEAITLDNVYKIMQNFGKLYAIMSDEEKKSLITYLIKEIQIYPNGDPNAEDGEYKQSIGSYDGEPATAALMHELMEWQGYALNITDQRLHHEIYLSDASMVAPERLKTVVRHPIRER